MAEEKVRTQASPVGTVTARLRCSCTIWAPTAWLSAGCACQTSSWMTWARSSLASTAMNRWWSIDLLLASWTYPWSRT